MPILEHRDNKKILVAQGGRNIGITLKSTMCLRRVYKLKTGDSMTETIAELKFTKADGVGDATTKFEPKNKKDWDKIIRALNEHEAEIFIMECIGKEEG